MKIIWSELLDHNRGRPRQPWHSLKDMTCFTYMLRIILKYDMNIQNFFEGLYAASYNERSHLDNILIEFRGKTTEKELIFLITRENQKLISQFRISQKLLDQIQQIDFSTFEIDEYINHR